MSWDLIVIALSDPFWLANCHTCIDTCVPREIGASAAEWWFGSIPINHSSLLLTTTSPMNPPCWNLFSLNHPRRCALSADCWVWFLEYCLLDLFLRWQLKMISCKIIFLVPIIYTLKSVIHCNLTLDGVSSRISEGWWTYKQTNKRLCTGFLWNVSITCDDHCNCRYYTWINWDHCVHFVSIYSRLADHRIQMVPGVLYSNFSCVCLWLTASLSSNGSPHVVH